MLLNSATKIRKSEQNAKGKLVFLFIFERKYLRPKVRGTKKYGINKRKSNSFNDSPIVF